MMDCYLPLLERSVFITNKNDSFGLEDIVEACYPELR